MALKYRKGFVQTLEAVLASTLVLGVVLNVVPEFQQESNTQPRQQVLSGLETLDKTGKLNNNLVAANIESEIKPYVPKGYNYSANIVEVESASGRISGSEERYIDTDGNYSEIQLWIDSSSSLNISFNGDTILQNYSEQGYEIIQVPLLRVGSTSQAPIVWTIAFKLIVLTEKQSIKIEYQ